MVVTCSQMRDAEEAAFARGVSAADLMEEAGSGIAAVLTQFFPGAGHAVLYLGKGNNAGDALVAARHLQARGWMVHARLAYEPDEFKELPAGHWKSLGRTIARVSGPDDILRLRGTVVLLDGLVGIGATGTLQGSLADAVREMNGLRRSRHAFTVALDIPSGLDTTTGSPGVNTVEADLTVAIAQVKDVLLRDEALNHVGRLAVVPLRELEHASGDDSRRLLTTDVLRPMLPRRRFDFHKGDSGRVGIIAGSRGFLGAAVLCAKGAVRGGAGLVTLFAKDEIYPLMAPLAPPEVMVRSVKDFRQVLEEKWDALAIGPGLGQAGVEEMLAVMSQASAPTVIDADAINLLARHGLGTLPREGAPKLLTPHPGEMARLVTNEEEWKKLDRTALATAFVKKHPHLALLLKGARTLVAAQGRPLSFNSTGHPGMATGGMGDVLTGLCAALAAQGVALPDAACLGAWLGGRAAELALRDGRQSAESLAAGDVAQLLGAAFTDLRGGVY